jgi:hypothetical protein
MSLPECFQELTARRSPSVPRLHLDRRLVLAHGTFRLPSEGTCRLQLFELDNRSKDREAATAPILDRLLFGRLCRAMHNYKNGRDLSVKTVPLSSLHMCMRM